MTNSKLTTEQQQWIDATAEEMQKRFAADGTGHDWWHLWRVWQLATHIGEQEGADPTTTQLGALLHDIADHKFHGGDRTVGPRMAREWLESINVNAAIIDAVCDIIPKVSYSGSGGKKNMDTLEGMAVQDADRLDAIGAIAISRTFHYEGYRGGQQFVPPEDTLPDAEERRAQTGIQHFHDKLLKLHGLLNTETAKKIGAKRHAYMEQYLQQFEDEWYGRDWQ